MTNNYEKAKKIYKRVKDNGKFYHWYASKQISNILIIEKKEDLAQKLLKKAFAFRLSAIYGSPGSTKCGISCPNAL